ncbi:MAG: diaminopimelate decarboxylase [Balneolaceae bacterium]
MFHLDLIRQFQNLKTPFFYYDLNTLNQTIEVIREHGVSRGYSIHFALKANNNDRILKRMLDAGFGADCVSGGEIEKSIEAGFSPDQIAFAGVGKSDEEILTGLKYNLFSFNCESVQELEVLNHFAGQQNKNVRIALRVNPNVEAKTHKYITTGLQDNKFGIPSENLPGVLDKIKEYPHLNLTGLHFHIGSQIMNLDVFRELSVKINQLQSLFDEKENQLRHINVGGGLGIDYAEPDRAAIPDFQNYFRLFEEHLDLRDYQELHFELGRSVVGQCGSLITKVLFTKEGRNTNFAVVDAGMTELIRPALYQARHTVEALTSTRPEKQYDVVGPICETSDTFRTGILLPEVERGDLLAIRSCGAYGQVMSSDYNLRERAKAYYTDDFDLE